MKAKTYRLEGFQQRLGEWRGSAVRFNTFVDDHDRLHLALTHPAPGRDPVDLAFFYCTYLAGPTSWESVELDLHEIPLEDGSLGYEVCDTRAGFVVRCASVSLYWEEHSSLPEPVRPRST